MFNRLMSIALTCALLAACSKAPAPTAPAGGKLLESAHGRWLLVNYWADWCKPCLNEMPQLAEFSRKHADQAVLYAVNFDGAQGDHLEQLKTQLHIEVPVLKDDPATELGLTRPEGLPTTFVFGPNGVLQQVLLGEQTEATLEAAIAQPVKATPPS